MAESEEEIRSLLMKVKESGGRRRRGWQRMRWLDGITNSKDMGLGELRKIMKDRGAWCATGHGVTKSAMSELPEQQECRITQQ